MLWRVEVCPRSDVRDVKGEGIARKIRNELGIDPGPVAMVKVYTVSGLDEAQIRTVIERGALHDPVLHDVSLDPLPGRLDSFGWTLEVGFRPGVTDNEGRTAREAAAMALGLKGKDAAGLTVFTSDRCIIGAELSEAEVVSIAEDLLCNNLIQRYEYKSAAEWAKAPGFEPKAAEVTATAVDTIETIALTSMTDDELVAFSRANTLALSLKEMHEMQDYFRRPEVIEARKAMGLGADPTDAEVEVLAQTWSEHCKHKIFTARINYEDKETGEKSVVDSLFKTYIQGSTAAIRKEQGEEDLCLSVFKDNAGVIKFNERMNVCVKMETHNSPSALDPYGGALTGIVGVNRDPMGTGMGANLLCNTDVFCFASPFHEGELPPRLLHPRRVFEGVREGVEHGGNKSGIPTVNGSVVFDERYLGKPLVYCGTIGTMPVTVPGKNGLRPSHEKQAEPGDVIVMAGGRIGKDGIHGATFSSEELHEGSPATAVQIGDPITQRKMYDFLMRARNMGLYNAITDNGAGGLSSSVGEMAQDCGGCDMDLSKAPLKYDGLRPWEILISEAQERMTMAVPPEDLDAFLELAEEMDVEAVALGTYTDSGMFLVRHGENIAACLDMDFLHDGVPQMELEAVWEKPAPESADMPEIEDQGAFLKAMLGRLNICSKEYLIRQYDHEVQGGSAVKPLTGVKRDGPSDSGVVRPDLADEKGLVVSHGICPKYSDLDTYWMMANAIDEAVRNAVASGGDVRRMAGVDNFCWCDPVESESTPDGKYKLAQLVRANRALDEFCRAYSVPCISGKDSMKNDYKGGDVKISIPPTVLFSVVGLVGDVNKCLSSDFKKPGDLIYILGTTANELGGSELADELGLSFAEVPKVDAESALKRYRAVYDAAQQGLVSACHDLSDGGLGTALAEMAIGGRLGADFDLALCPADPEGLGVVERMYSESASRFLVTVAPENKAGFEKLFAGQVAVCAGTVSESGRLIVRSSEIAVLDESVEDLAAAFKSTLDW